MQRQHRLHVARPDLAHDLHVIVFQHVCAQVPWVWFDAAPFHGETIGVHAQRAAPVQVVFEHVQIRMVYGRSGRPQSEVLRGRRQFAQSGHARVNDRVGCEEIPIVIGDIAFHLVAGRRRSPEKIRRKHVAHDCHPRLMAWSHPSAQSIFASTIIRFGVDLTHMRCRYKGRFFVSPCISVDYYPFPLVGEGWDGGEFPRACVGYRSALSPPPSPLSGVGF